ncbi:SLOG family protein [Halalkalibacillus halophilus]|uniref:SLOG family protein n=1 Tax=Halalkalibacillus halophilus TaxID=392827 RepID=UPI000402BA57|nr:DUF1273 domain-containing protein [Halalkalibacillus halophilus]
MTIKSITITGYKPHELGIFSEQDEKIKVIQRAIYKRLVSLIEEGLEWVVISGQPGIETWAFQVVMDLKNDYSIKVAIIPPFKNQEKIWKDDKQSVYRNMLEKADFSKPLSDKDYESSKQYQQKNQWMIEKTEGCLIVYEEEFGGSPKFFYDLVLQYQLIHAYDLIIINSFDLEDTAREMEEF